MSPPLTVSCFSKIQIGFTFLVQATDSGWQWHQLGHMQVCTSLQTTTPAPHHSVFTGRMPFLLPNQQRQSTEGTSTEGTTSREIEIGFKTVSIFTLIP